MTGDDAARWQATKQLRARTRRFHAYLLAGSRAGASELTDTESAGLAAQMQQNERAAARRASPPRARA
jgi:hypothetical protein